VDLRVRHRAEVAEQRLETERFAETEKITEKQIKNQSHFDGFFGLPWNCAPRIRTRGSNCQCSFLRGGFEASERRVRRVRPELWEGRRWILHHDNAPAHSALIVLEFLARNCITVLEYPHYLLDLAPCDFFLFPKANWCCGGGIWGM